MVALLSLLLWGRKELCVFFGAGDWGWEEPQEAAKTRW